MQGHAFDPTSNVLRHWLLLLPFARPTAPTTTPSSRPRPHPHAAPAIRLVPAEAAAAAYEDLELAARQRP